MKNLLIVGLLLAATLLSCTSSPPTRFYMLSSAPDMTEKAGKTDDGCISLGVGPVETAAYLTRLKIATSASENEINYAEFDHWAQPLSDGISQVMAENLSKLLCTRAVYRFPWNVPEQPDYRVRVEVSAMTGSLGGTAAMEARWTITDKEKKVIVSRKSRYSEPVPGQDYKALAQAYSMILGAFSKDVAKTITAR